jgi:hypothetical protein
MKKLFFLAAIMLMLGSCEKQIRLNTSDVPSAVIAAFNQKYPGAKEVQWKAEEEGGFYFEASFKMNGAEKEVHYKTDGTFVEEEK